MKMRPVAYIGSLVLLVAGSFLAGPVPTHADTDYAAAATVGTCAAGATPTKLSSLYMQLTGAANAAAPAATIAQATTNPGTLTITSPSTTGTTVVNTTALTSTTPQEFGYAAYIRGVSPVFQPFTYNERTALFTFWSTASTVTDTAPSFFFASARTGTITFYISTGLAGNFATPSTFASGTAVMTATFTQQILANSGNIPGSSFTAQVPAGNLANAANLNLGGTPSVGPNFQSTSVNTITSVAPFSLGGTCYQLGSVGQTFTRTDVGHLASPTTLFGSFQGVTNSTT